MSDRGDDPSAAPVGEPARVRPTPAPPAGWYSDPWRAGWYRYWTSEVWTDEVFADTARATTADRSPWAPPLLEAAEPNWQPAPDDIRWRLPPAGEAWRWTPPHARARGAGEGAADGAAEEHERRPQRPPPPSYWSSATEEEPPLPRMAPVPSGPKRYLPTIALVVSLILGFAVVVVLVGRIGPKTGPSGPAAATRPLPTLPPLTTAPTDPETDPTEPSTPVDPDVSSLATLDIRPADVAVTNTVQAIPGGTDVAGQATLDLCNGTYASEAMRTARLQVAETDAQGNQVLSTEAVLYSTPGATAQAFVELRTTVARCPASPVVSPVGEPTVTTRFNPSPDAAWGNTTTVERAAFDFVTTDQIGQTHRSIAVYLRRGRVLLGIYFSHPDGSQPPVNGHSTVAAIVRALSSRLAQLPSSVVNGA
jgi:hypothetical protein